MPCSVFSILKEASASAWLPIPSSAGYLTPDFQRLDKSIETFIMIYHDSSAPSCPDISLVLHSYSSRRLHTPPCRSGPIKNARLKFIHQSYSNRKLFQDVSRYVGVRSLFLLLSTSCFCVAAQDHPFNLAFCFPFRCSSKLFVYLGSSGACTMRTSQISKRRQGDRNDRDMRKRARTCPACLIWSTLSIPIQE